MSEKHKKVCRAMNYLEHFIVFVSVVIGCVSNSAFGSLVGVPVGIISSTVGLEIHEITAGFKKYELNDKKKWENFDKAVLLGKSLVRYYLSANL